MSIYCVAPKIRQLTNQRHARKMNHASPRLCRRCGLEIKQPHWRNDNGSLLRSADGPHEKLHHSAKHGRDVVVGRYSTVHSPIAKFIENYNAERGTVKTDLKQAAACSTVKVTRRHRRTQSQHRTLRPALSRTKKLVHHAASSASKSAIFPKD